jgi:dimethylargininase
MFTKAIVRPPAPNFAEGLTTADLGTPDYQRALKQHEGYCAALEQCGLRLIRLAADSRYPDSTFVEDTAVLTDKCAVLTKSGAPSRSGEVESMGKVLADLFPSPRAIQPPGTLDGGDVCEAGNHFFIGISERTNEAGAQQLAELLAPFGYTTSFVDITKSGTGVRGPRRGSPAGVPDPPVTHAQDARATHHILHLKSGLAFLGDNRLAVIEALANRSELRGYDLVHVNDDEMYAANCIRINDHVLVAAGYPLLESKLRELGYQTIALDMTEFQKMDGGLSCLSLRF